MDRKSLIGLLLIGALLVVYSVFTRPSKEELAESQRISDSIQRVRIKQQEEAKRLLDLQESVTPPAVVVQDSVATIDQLEKQLGVFATAGQGEEKIIVLENDLIRVKISNHGGRLASAELKEYQTHDSLPLILFEEENSKFNLQFFAENKSIFTQDLFFEPQSSEENIVVSSGPKSVTMRLNAGTGRYMDYIYTLEPDSYKLGMHIKMVGMDEILGRNNSYIDLDWSMPLRQQEKAHKIESQYSSIYYKYFEDDVGHLQSRKAEGAEDLTTKVEWVGFKQQFFSTVLFTEKAFSRVSIKVDAMEEDSGYLKYCSAQISIPLEGGREELIPLAYYFLPNHFKSLKEYNHEFESLVDLGWDFISWINKWFVINIFYFLETKVASYGLIIILLTIFFKLLLLPLSYRSYISGAKMRVLKPQLDEITKKFSKDKAMEKQQATMAFYKKVGVSPMGGCLPSLMQMPIWLALFRFFPASIELRQKSFLWATDLSTYDSILNLPFEIPLNYGDHVSLFTLLMAASMVISTKINMQQTDTGQQMPGMKMMMYMMPVMMLFFFNSYASGLSLYYLVSNLITFGQMTLIKRSINEEKLLKKLTQNQKKPAKKSNFQARLEKMAKERGAQPASKKKKR